MSKLVVQVEDKLKKEASKLYKNLGLDIDTAVRMFLIQSVRTRSLPINVTLEEPFISDEEFIKMIEEEMSSNGINFNNPTNARTFFGNEDFLEDGEVFDD